MDKFKVISINRHRMYIDGKGINTLVALAGCPLRCKYCLNKKVLEINKWKELLPEELASEVLIDYCYFLATGGGITFGGGEALLHSKQIKAFREVLPKDIPIKVETALNVPKERVLEVLDAVDEYIIDVKTLNPQIYQNYTGRSISLLLENLEVLRQNHMQSKCKIKIPNIPGFTTGKDVETTILYVKSMGFENIEVFDYIIKEEIESE